MPAVRERKKDKVRHTNQEIRILHVTSERHRVLFVSLPDVLNQGFDDGIFPIDDPLKRLTEYLYVLLEVTRFRFSHYIAPLVVQLVDVELRGPFFLDQFVLRMTTGQWEDHRHHENVI